MTEPTSAAPKPYVRPQFRVEVGEFVAFAMGSQQLHGSNRGQSTLTEQGGDGGYRGETALVHPKNCRSQRPSVKVRERRVDTRVRHGRGEAGAFHEIGAYGSNHIKFLSFTKSEKIPRHVWVAVAESEQMDVDEEEEEDE